MQPTVLCVGFDDGTLNTRKLVLETERYQVLIASPSDLLEALARNRIDCVILDMCLTHDDTAELARLMTTAFPEIPVVLLTSVDNVPESVRAIVHACLLKLEGPQKLLRCIEKAIAWKKAVA